jgi:hypothetical protein
MTDQTRPTVRYVIRWKQASELAAMTASALAVIVLMFWRV